MPEGPGSEAADGYATLPPAVPSPWDEHLPDALLYIRVNKHDNVTELSVI